MAMMIETLMMIITVNILSENDKDVNNLMILPDKQSLGEEKDVGHSWLQEQITGSARGTFSHARCRGESDFSQLAWQLILVHPTWLFLQRTVVVR